MNRLIDLLFQSFEINGERNAFCIGDEYYTYSDLRASVSGIINLLSENKLVGSGKSVGLVCHDHINTYASILALWFSKCSYVPLGFHNPIDRNVAILEDVQAEFVLSTIEVDDKLNDSFKVINTSAVYSTNSIINYLEIKDDDLAYILFTSGSTGKPKGVPISFGNINSFLDAFCRSGIEYNSVDRCLQMFELTFDVSISSFLPPLLSGACVYTIGNSEIKYIQVFKLLSKYNLTIVQIVPSIIRLALPIISRVKSSFVRVCILTGEATNIELLPVVKNVFKGANIYNFYGPTEATIFCSCYKCEDSIKSYNDLLAIGKPFNNSELIIINEFGREAAINVKGELLISSPQLTSGYVNNPEVNERSFCMLDYNGSSRRFYRSGDLAYKDECGDIFYCGRLDKQVKLHGFRVELSEIEMIVRNRFLINNVVIPVSNEGEIMSLCLVLENRKNNDLSDEVMNFMKLKLPSYMVPNRILFIPEFPLNSSGKTDIVTIKTLLNDH